MTTRRDVVAAARGWIGTPFHASARLKGVGVDCAGLVIGVMRELKLCAPDWDVPPYRQTPDGVSMLAQCDLYMRRITQEEMQPGDVICTVCSVHPQHLGILADHLHFERGLAVIHASNNRAEYRVIETRLMFSRISRFVAAYALPGVA